MCSNHTFVLCFLEVTATGVYFLIWLLTTLSLTYSLDYLLTQTNLRYEWLNEWHSLTRSFTYLEKQAKSYILWRELRILKNFKNFVFLEKLFYCFPAVLFLISFYVVWSSFLHYVIIFKISINLILEVFKHLAVFLLSNVSI